MYKLKYYRNITIILHFYETIEKMKMIVYNKNIQIAQVLS